MSHQSDLIAEDINQYLQQHQQKQLLRFLTCGNVDDGKSTLIGRLLHDSKMIYEDQLATVTKDSEKVGTTGEKVDLALLVDGLQAEREQGITIDVAYRYFSTEKRKFIIADTPGHEQYTRNMATGASTCDLAIILIDARYGVQTQTKRHSYIASLLGIKNIIVAVNKMDLTDFDESVFEKIKIDFLNFSENLDLKHIQFVPLSALDGDNVVDKSARSPWYIGKSLMEMLETVEINPIESMESKSKLAEPQFRFPVQWVSRPNLDFRGFAGTIAEGAIKPGDQITALPSGKTSTVDQIVTFDGNLDKATKGQAVTLTLNDEIDISRGDILVKSDQQTKPDSTSYDSVIEPLISSKVQANLVWMSEQALRLNKPYLIKFLDNPVSGNIQKIEYKTDVNSLEQVSDPVQTKKLELNEIASVQIQLSKELVFDTYKQNRSTGSFIVIDRLTNVTVGAGMVSALGKTSLADSLNRTISTEEKALRFEQKPTLINSTSLELARQIDTLLFDHGKMAVLLEQKIDKSTIEQLLANGLIVITCTDERDELTELHSVEIDSFDPTLILNSI